MTNSTFIYKEADDEDGEDNADEANFVAVFVHFLQELFFGFDAGHFRKIVTYSGKDGIPNTSTQCGEKEKGSYFHTRQSGRDGDKLAHGRDKSANEGGNGSVLVEEVFGILHLCFVNQTHMSKAAIGEFIDDGATEPFGQEVVDECTDIGTNGSKKDNEIDIQASITSGGFPCGGWHDHFGREGDERTLNSHQQGDSPIIKVFETPLNECN